MKLLTLNGAFSKRNIFIILFSCAMIFGYFAYIQTSDSKPSVISSDSLRQPDHEVGISTTPDSTLKIDSSQSLESSRIDTVYEDYQTGQASWYGLGDGYHGKKSASGEIFDTYSNMCAHKTLPFGTLLRVTNLKNDKSTIVRVVDRGPFVKGRIIDLSYFSKEEIGMGGVAQVKLEIIKFKKNGQEITSEKKEKKYHSKKHHKKKK